MQSVDHAFSKFLREHVDEIVAEWQTFAGTMSPAADAMDPEALRDHARQMIEAIACDLEKSQTSVEQAQKGKGLAPAPGGPPSAAATHGVLRQRVGFDLVQLVAEFRALRASVLRIWIAHGRDHDPRFADQLARFNESVDQALSESVLTYSGELAKSRDTFLGILGHDLRSPLSAIATALEVTAKATEERTREAALAAGKRSIATMSAMIRDLLEYTRARLGAGIPFTPAHGNLESICKAAITEIVLVHPQTQFRMECGGALEGEFDTERLHQVVANLLNNAVRHGAVGKAVSLIASGNDEALVLKVHNFGKPIAPADLEAIFRPMVRLPDEAGGKSAQNLGLGLFICREIVQSHGGTIEVESSQAKGTTFTVTLPRSAARSASGIQQTDAAHSA